MRISAGGRLEGRGRGGRDSFFPLSPCGRGWIAERSEGEPGEGSDRSAVL
jgi:hypothetical protein